MGFLHVGHCSVGLLDKLLSMSLQFPLHTIPHALSQQPYFVFYFCLLTLFKREEALYSSVLFCYKPTCVSSMM